MNRVKKLGLCTLLFLFCMCTTSICLDNNIEYKEDIELNNTNINDLEIKVIDINVKEEQINIGDVYNACAIITMNIENNSDYNVELSNIDIYPYQGEKETKYFVSTAKENITGFIGDIKSGESKNIKMGIALHNTKETINLEMCNIEDVYNKKIVKSIKIK